MSKRQQYDKLKKRYHDLSQGPEYLAAKQNVVRMVNANTKLWPLLFDLTNDDRCDWLQVERIIMEKCNETTATPLARRIK